MMELKDILQPDCVKVPLESRNKEQVIAELVGLLDQANLLNDYDVALKAVLEREAVRSTGVGQGFAIPHGKCNAVDKLIMAVGKTAVPIDFNSIDKHPVEIIILLLSPLGQTGPHIQALARVSRLMTTPETREDIYRCQTAEELYKSMVEPQINPVPK